MNEEIQIERKEEQEIPEMTEKIKEEAGGNLNKKRLGMGAAVVIIIVLLLGISIYQSPVNRLSRKLDLGQKYLEEMNYEQAVAVFQNVIEIDPMNADAYLGLVEVYIRTGDFDTALTYAKKGYELTGDERLKERIDMIESGNIMASNGWVMKESCYDDGQLMWYEVYTYDLQGRRKTTTLYNGVNQLVGRGDWLYDEQGNVVVQYGCGLYTNGDPLSAMMEAWKYEYDAEGRRIGRKEYDSSGNLISEHMYE